MAIDYATCHSKHFGGCVEQGGGMYGSGLSRVDKPFEPDAFPSRVAMYRLDWKKSPRNPQ